MTVCGVCGCALLASARSKTRTHTIEHTRAHTDTPALERCAVCAQHPHGRHALGAEGGLSGAAPSRQQMGHNFGDGRSSSWTRCRLQLSPPRLNMSGKGLGDNVLDFRLGVSDRSEGMDLPVTVR